MTLKINVHVDENGNAVVPLGIAFQGQDVSLTCEVNVPLERKKRSAIRSAKHPLTGQAYQDFVQSLYGSYPEEIPEPPDPPSAPEKIF